MAGRLDDILLGLVDIVGAVCRDVYSADIARADDKGVYGRCDVCSDSDSVFLVVYVRRKRDVFGDERGRRPGDGGDSGGGSFMGFTAGVIRNDRVDDRHKLVELDDGGVGDVFVGDVVYNVVGFRDIGDNDDVEHGRRQSTAEV